MKKSIWIYLIILLSGNLIAQTVTLTDIEGNTYKTVKIGNQIWMAENLKTTKFNDGTAIPLVIKQKDWNNLTTAGYCWYKNDSSMYSRIYGALYNWYAVNTGKLCPVGWNVPTEAAWISLLEYLGTFKGDELDLDINYSKGWINVLSRVRRGYYDDEDIEILEKINAAIKLKETGTVHWQNMSNENNNTNESGFTARPGGCRFKSLGFKFLGKNGYWWSWNERRDESANMMKIEGKSDKAYSPLGQAYTWWDSKSSGYSVRCIKYQ